VRRDAIPRRLVGFNPALPAAATLVAFSGDHLAEHHHRLLLEQALTILSDQSSQLAFRYLAGPPVSEDDFKTLVDTNSLARTTLQRDPELVQRLITTILSVLDRRRFPWVFEQREPTPAEREAAVLATAALAATRRVETNRRTQGKSTQEEAVRQELLREGFQEISLPNATARTLSQAPKPGEFCGEATLAGRKADLIVGLWDHRVMPIECKVSNSSLNSIKRLNNDAAAKAEHWLDNLGQVHIVPVAVLKRGEPAATEYRPSCPVMADRPALQYSSGSKRVVTLRSHSVMIHSFSSSRVW
jgi:hypothetical protein